VHVSHACHTLSHASHSFQILAVTEDDKYEKLKKELCAKVGAQYVVLPKTLSYNKTSTTEILQQIKAPHKAPLRVRE
jgi:hypothetical protein